MMNKKVLVLTGGGDCPGLNAVIRGIVKRASVEKGWEIWGSISSYNGLMSDPEELILLTEEKVKGLHVQGGTILKTTNRGNPLSFPEKQPDGTFREIDITGDITERIKEKGFHAVISIGGDGSQRISEAMFQKGAPIIGVPKTIDNDLSCTDISFGFQTAVQIATDSLDKLVTTAESHHRVMIMEVMGRNAGWIALHTAIAGGAEICLIPEIPYDLQKVVERINGRYNNGRGFVNIVIAEGAYPSGGETFSMGERKPGENKRLGGVAFELSNQLKNAGCEADIRETVLGHIQRGGTPIAGDRILASAFGVKAFEMVLEEQFGKMVSFQNNQLQVVSLKEATEGNNFITPDSYLIATARGLNISLGD